jgi:hypothetical protein
MEDTSTLLFSVNQAYDAVLIAMAATKIIIIAGINLCLALIFISKYPLSLNYIK